MRIELLVCGALAVVACGASDGPPIQGKKRGELCAQVSQPPAFRCPDGTRRKGAPPPEGTEMWCERKDDSARQGPYRRFPPSSDAAAPAYVGDGVVVGEYANDRQHGAWYTRRAGADGVSVQFFEDGKVTQRIQCR